MPQVLPYQPIRRFTALAFVGLYSLASVLSSAVLFWVIDSSTSSLVALGQTQSEQPSTSADPDAEELLEEARERLIDRGEILNPDPETDLGVPLNQLSPEFDAYRLGPGDAVAATLPFYPELNFQVTLDLEGNVIVPLAGVLSLEGLTLQQATDRIQTALNRYVINPQVDLILTTQRPVEVTITGEVVRPGVYPLAAPQLTTALLSAGGTTRLADLRTVRVRRTLTDGSVVEQNIDLYTPLREANGVPDVRLADGDSIIIPTLTSDAIADYDRNLIARSTISQQQIVVRVLNYSAGGRAVPGAISSITLPSSSHFLDALTTIGVSPSTADLGEVALVRFDPEQGRAISQELDAKEALLGNASQDPPLENNDVIVVGRNFVSRITYALNTVTQPFRDVLGFLLFFDSLADGANDLFGPGDDDDD
ncbi:polysaccharide export protein [Leptolyngbya sp. FACHB-541]|uniref:polysaccharide biosynthesis/export family protein n=1 Tax=Leptolyngbya sp. FACHB-541 TaxID=2692810 RepID=UPI0016852F3B|nr:polysaccharide biosynthesis/export family protein [Leptolyngbya sp. FACHB-541]MBD1998380.1 polysaccharide export protein [Leptolyngbya sp. FACHB-541]